MRQRYTSRIRDIIADITKHLPKNAHEAAPRFIERFYEQIPLEELERIPEEKAAAVVLDALEFMKMRKAGNAKIRIFTPKKGDNGYESHHMIVQVANDDKPFLVDSLTNEINRLGFTTYTTYHPLFRIKRDTKGNLQEVLPDSADDGLRESLIHFEISSLPEGMSEEDLHKNLEHILENVDLAIGDWKSILTKAVEVRDAAEQAKHFNQEDIIETTEFLDWLMHKNFVFLGYVGVDFEMKDGKPNPSIDHNSLLGVSKIDDIPMEISVGSQLSDVRKASRYSKVHRRALMDVITVKRVNEEGQITGEHRFYGLFTSSAYYQEATSIPMVGRKIERLVKRTGFPSHSHNGKALVAILQFMPRDELFQINDDDLFGLSMGILALETRPGVKLFARMDMPRRYISAIVYVPRELFSTDVRTQVTQTLEKHFHATEENFETNIGESPLARLHIVFRTSEKTPEVLDTESIERELSTAIMLWADRLQAALHKQYGEQQAEQLYRLYAHAFDAAYISRYPIKSTIHDIDKMQSCLEHEGIEIELYRERNETRNQLHLKIYNIEEDIALSDILPKLENMGLKVLDEFPYAIHPLDKPCLRIRDIRMELSLVGDFSLEQIKPNIEELLLKVWNQKAEDDQLNGLAFSANLNVKQIEILRACAQYLKQIKFTYGKQSIAKALLAHPELALLLVHLFESRFDPSESERDNKMNLISSQLEQGLSQVDSLQDDKIISTLHQLIKAILRTNYYIRGTEGASEALSFKISSAQVPDIPLPKPFVEIFVYSARVEGVHLRGGKVARGGLRWSDRMADFRTEILGLMKAQVVKNAVIVPVGSKGGFVVKQVSPADREAFRDEGVECYKQYLRSMLDITDNVVDGSIVHPKNVVRHDGDDPYLVVAADKGTATFSDTANSVSAEYGFWLDDAFASGGSAGYDHKAMGITARGAWVSVQQHFAEMGHNMETTPFTTVGVGDMGGDVFGNGMLLSKNIKLVAAFNHLHIFLDPDPDPEKSYGERKRLFEMPRSSWMDYDKKIMSKGGEIFERSAKEVKLNPQIQKLLETEKTSCSPDQLIKMILKAPVDLFWNGGIGTYVKASFETHEQVGDRANNTVRINGEELRAKLVGEGGNLGFTQQGRIEYAKTGGRINTDAIDNSAGVDCSDHEVNIKIALKSALGKGKLDTPKRNKFLESMTEDVAALVLKDNQLQTEAISVEQHFAAERLPSHSDLMRALEARDLLNRDIEFLPSEARVGELRERNQGLTRPEISVLLAYSKIALFDDVVNSSMPDEPYFAVDLRRYFPPAMLKKFESEIDEHSLRREIIATVATNSMVNRAGISFYFDVLETTGLPTRDIVAAYSLARDILRMRDIWGGLEDLKGKIDADIFAKKYDKMSKLLKFTTFWLLRHRSLPLDIDKVMKEFCAPAKDVMKTFDSMLTETQAAPFTERKKELKEVGVNEDLAHNLAMLPMFNSLFDICSIASKNKQKTDKVGKSYYMLAEELQFFDLVDKTKTIVTLNRWDRLALQSLLHEFYDELANLTNHITEAHKNDIGSFKETHGHAFNRLTSAIDDMLARDHLTSPMLMVVLQQLKQMTHH